MAKIKIQCEAITRTLIRLGKPKRCKAKGYFTPSTRRMLCRFHGCSKTIDSKTRKYKGLYKNTNIDIEKKINILKNLKNFKGKTDNEIKQYIIQEQTRASNFKQYRTKYYTRSYHRWRNRLRTGKRLTDKLENLIQLLGPKPKV